MSTKQNDTYFEMINELIQEDKAQKLQDKIENDIISAKVENILTAREANEMGLTGSCTECGEPTCLGEYTHYQHTYDKN